MLKDLKVEESVEDRVGCRMLDCVIPALDRRPPMNFMNFSLLLSASTSNVIGQFFLKSGAEKFGKVEFTSLNSFVMTIVNILFIPHVTRHIGMSMIVCGVIFIMKGK